MHMLALITYGSITNLHEPYSISQQKCCNINGNSVTFRSVNRERLARQEFKDFNTVAKRSI